MYSLKSLGPFVNIYYANEFAPMLIFFLIFLCVVKNTRISHFVRFNAMQVNLVGNLYIQLKGAEYKKLLLCMPVMCIIIFIGKT